MIFWVGLAPHLTYLPRKPTPLGIMMKTLVCAVTGILLVAEIDKGKKVMEKEKYRKDWGHTTATTLRLCEPYFGKKKILIADAWFGGLRCAYALLQ
jgi:Transposase IS4